jgi:predicted histidine transporter YuiF (NhaC family)
MNGKIMQPDSTLIRAALEPLLKGQSLSTSEMQMVMLDIMQGHANDAQISAFLVALRIKGETVSELEGSVRAMRDLMKRVALSNLDRTVDIVLVVQVMAQIWSISQPLQPLLLPPLVRVLQNMVIVRRLPNLAVPMYLKRLESV